MAYSRNWRATSRSGRAIPGSGSAGSTRTAPATVSGVAVACSRLIVPPIELPTRIAGPPTTWWRKRSSSRWLARTVAGRPAGGGQAVAGQVQGEDPVVLGERRPDRQPVDVGAAETVHADQHRRARRPAEVQEVHRAAELDGPGGRLRARPATGAHGA
jgi:hypothetical protein